MAAPPPQTFPYDYLFKVLIIGDASVGKVSSRVLLPYFDVLMRAAYLRKGEFFFYCLDADNKSTELDAVAFHG